jgi:hypothetical protein
MAAADDGVEWEEVDDDWDVICTDQDAVGPRVAAEHGIQFTMEDAGQTPRPTRP